jgi:alkylresorcinol/alkylpyrone synthase
MTTIAAVRSAFPHHRYPQAEFTRMVAELSGLGPVQRALLERLHRNSGVNTRHTVLPLAEYRETHGIGIGATNDRYIEAATELGEQALRAALDASGLAARDLDLLIVTSVTGVTVPSLDARLIPRVGLRSDIKRLPIFGLGCVGGAAALARLHDYLLAWPQHTAALVAVEVCSFCWPTTEVTTADLVVSGLFADGAAGLVVAGEQAPATRAGGPRVIATHSEVCPDSGDALGWRLGSDGFRIVLTAELADVVERTLAGTVTSFLARHGRTVDDISTWIGHPGGPKVIDAIQHSLKLPDSAVENSRRSLAEVGNLSSVSVLHVLEMTADTGPPSAGSYGLMIGLGPGVSIELLLMQWLTSDCLKAHDGGLLRAALAGCLAAGRAGDYERAWLRVTRRSRVLTSGLLWSRNQQLIGPRIVLAARRLPWLFTAIVSQVGEA